MAKQTHAVEIPAELRPVLLATAKNLLHHLYGPHGPPWGTSFAELEELLLKLSDTMTTKTGRRLSQRRAAFMHAFLIELRDELEL